MVGGGTGGVREPIHAPVSSFVVVFFSWVCCSLFLAILPDFVDTHRSTSCGVAPPVDKPKLSHGNGGGVCERGERGCGWRLGSG